MQANGDISHWEGGGWPSQVFLGSALVILACRYAEPPFSGSFMASNRSAACRNEARVGGRAPARVVPQLLRTPR